MSDGSSTPENEVKPLPTAEKVTVMLLPGQNGLGVEQKNKGASYDLGKTFRNRADGFSFIYFRTESGNIYCLEDQGEEGELINLNESKELGDIYSRKFDSKYLERQKITVGEPLNLSDKDEWIRTGRVSEIVAVTGRQYSPDSLLTITKGKFNNIVDEFNSKMPVLPAIPGIPKPQK